MRRKWSFSQMKQWTNCPKQFQEVRLLENFSIPDTEQTIYGKEVHTALENYVKHGTPLPKNYRRFQKAVDSLLGIPGERHTELKMGLKQDRVTACDFDDPDYWVHGIADLVIVDRDHAFSVDYKTGSPRYADTKQLKLMALMVMARFPQVNYVKSGLLFLAHDLFIPDDYTRDDSHDLWEAFRQPLQLFEVYMERDHWPANPSGLCRKHCPVHSCQYHGRRR